MTVIVRSFAKINIGLRIGPRRDDGFHPLRTLYQTVGVHDTLRVDLARGTGIEIRSKNSKVPTDESNTCYRIADRVMRTLKARGRLVISIDKSVPVQGGLGGASSNAIATMVALERLTKSQLPAEERLRIAAEVGSDLPLFLIGGAVLGVGRGEEVYPVPDLPPLHCVIATPEASVSTPQAFAAWDDRTQQNQNGRNARNPPKLTESVESDKINTFSRSVFAWLGSYSTGVPAVKGGDRAEALLLDLVRAGIENDFETVVFPLYPELRELKRVFERTGASYASLSGSGSSVYGLFTGAGRATRAAAELTKLGYWAKATTTLARREYWKKFQVSGF
jgi:4-diphosphocytidyl-2-C-methyl-D-erythritol kinase